MAFYYVEEKKVWVKGRSPKGVLRKRARNIEMKSRNFEMKSRNIEMKPRNIEMKPRNIEMKPRNIEMMSRNIEMKPRISPHPLKGCCEGERILDILSFFRYKFD